MGSCKNQCGYSLQPVRKRPKYIQVCVCVFLGLCLWFPERCLLYSNHRENRTYTWNSLEKATGELALVTWAQCKDHLPPHRNQARSQGRGGNVTPPVRSCQGQMLLRETEHSCLLGAGGSTEWVDLFVLIFLLQTFPRITLSSQKLKALNSGW